MITDLVAGGITVVLIILFFLVMFYDKYQKVFVYEICYYCSYSTKNNKLKFEPGDDVLTLPHKIKEEDINDFKEITGKGSSSCVISSIYLMEKKFEKADIRYFTMDKTICNMSKCENPIIQQAEKKFHK